MTMFCGECLLTMIWVLGTAWNAGLAGCATGLALSTPGELVHKPFTFRDVLMLIEVGSFRFLRKV